MSLNQNIAHAGANDLFPKFTHGISVETHDIPSAASLISGPWYIDSNDTGPIEFLKKFNKPENQNKIPMIYTYLAAGNARSNGGLGDCNIGLPKQKTLCYGGANYIKYNQGMILEEYKAAANSIKKVYPTHKPILIHVEPDYYQYNGKDQVGGGLSFTELQTIMNNWTDALKAILPNASLVMDVASWNHDLEGFSKGLRNYDFAGLVGKRFDPWGDGECGIQFGVDCKSYNTIAHEVGKKLIINDSYGPGGYWLSYNYNWHDRKMVEERWKDNIAAVVLPPLDIGSYSSNANSYSYNPVSTYVEPIASYKPQSYDAIISNGNSPTCTFNDVSFKMTKGTSWNSGLIVYMKIKNDSKKTINGWHISLGWNKDQSYKNGWDHGMTPSTNGVILSPSVDWNTKVRPGQEVELGFEVKHKGNNNLPLFYYCSTK
ncbi:MAG: cellulose binding domain-containing protein [Patescibacteria group bacterium]